MPWYIQFIQPIPFFGPYLVAFIQSPAIVRNTIIAVVVFLIYPFAAFAIVGFGVSYIWAPARTWIVQRDLVPSSVLDHLKTVEEDTRELQAEYNGITGSEAWINRGSSLFQFMVSGNPEDNDDLYIVRVAPKQRIDFDTMDHYVKKGNTNEGCEIDRLDGNPNPPIVGYLYVGTFNRQYTKKIPLHLVSSQTIPLPGWDDSDWKALNAERPMDSKAPVDLKVTFQPEANFRKTVAHCSTYYVYVIATFGTLN